MMPVRAPEDRLPLGLSDFRDIRESGLVYVDKTDLICRLASKRRFYFFARPRRFGKSLLISTLAELFSKGKAAFEGLKGEALWTDQRTYKVVRLDFSLISDFRHAEQFSSLLREHVAEALEEADIRVPEGPSSAGGLLLKALKPLPERVVLLIDEYDAPLGSHLHEKELFATVRTELSGFFKHVKAASSRLRFLFVTGILKFRHAELFSGINIIRDLSLETEYGTLLGYTEDELFENFSEYLDYAAHVHGCGTPELVSRMRAMYDGYCFEKKGSTHVYAPWSVLNFLSSPEAGFQPFWYETGGPSSLLWNYLKSHTEKASVLNPDKFDDDHELACTALSGPVLSESMNEYVLLTQAGYLTIRHADGDALFVGLPNGEVRTALAALYRSAFWSSISVCNGLVRELREALQALDAHGVEAALNSMLHELDYTTYPLGSESRVRALVQILCLGGSLDTRIEVHGFRGRSDLEVADGEVDAVFEFKYATIREEVPGLLRSALEQTVSRDYGLVRKGRKRLRLGIVYCEETRRITVAEV